MLLSDAQGRVLAEVTPPALLGDQAWSLGGDGQYTANLAPTPGFPQHRRGRAHAAGPARAGKRQRRLYQRDRRLRRRERALRLVGGSQRLDAGGGHLRLGPFRRRRQPAQMALPRGNGIAARSVYGRLVSGMDGRDASGTLSASFRLPRRAAIASCFRMPAGALVDRVFVPEQYAGVAYARMENGGFLYVDQPTPNAQNGRRGLRGPRRQTRILRGRWPLRRG